MIRGHTYAQCANHHGPIAMVTSQIRRITLSIILYDLSPQYIYYLFLNSNTFSILPVKKTKFSKTMYKTNDFKNVIENVHNIEKR